jgi:hypothetical protein
MHVVIKCDHMQSALHTSSRPSTPPKRMARLASHKPAWKGVNILGGVQSTQNVGIFSSHPSTHIDVKFLLFAPLEKRILGGKCSSSPLTNDPST